MKPLLAFAIGALLLLLLLMLLLLMLLLLLLVYTPCTSTENRA